MSNTSEAPKAAYKLAKSSIKSVALETRDAGFEHETGDCVVKALSAVTGVPYRDAHKFCRENLGRRDRKGTQVAGFKGFENMAKYIYGYRVFEEKVGVLASRVNRQWMRAFYSYPTLAEFVRTHPTGKFLIWSQSHACAVIDGVVYDNGAAGARMRITGAYKFIESSRVETSPFDVARRQMSSLMGGK